MGWKRLVPPVLADLYRRRKAITFDGDYSHFSDALADSDGYESAAPVALAVQRASVPIDPEPCERTLQLLAAIALTGKTRLRVLDVGGADGQYFHRLHPYLDLDWTVLETPPMVAGLKQFERPCLRFVIDTQEAYDLVLMSGVIQYTPDPYAMLERYGRLGTHLIVTRMLLNSGSDRLTVQTVPGQASYPAWFLSEDRFLSALPGRLLMRWSVPQDRLTLDGQTVTGQGFIIEVDQINSKSATDRTVAPV